MLYTIIGIAFLVFIYFDLFYYPSKIRVSYKTCINKTGYNVYNNLYPGSFKNGALWAARALGVYRYDVTEQSFKFVKRVWLPVYTKQVLWNSRLMRWLYLHKRMGMVYVLSSGTLLFFTGAYIMRSSQNRPFKIEKKMEAGILRSGVTQDKNGSVYCGEYSTDKNKKYSDIFVSRNDGKDWEKFHRFSREEIRHIHMVKYDEYREVLWVTTGDRVLECMIGYFKNDNSITYIGSGGKEWRAVDLLIEKDYIYWGMDSPSVQNYLYRYDVHKKEKEKLIQLNGAAYYGVILKNGGKLLTTAIEGKAGELDNNVGVWYSTNGSDWERIIAVEADRSRKKFAIASVPTGDVVPFKAVHFRHTVHYDNALLLEIK